MSVETREKIQAIFRDGAEEERLQVLKSSVASGGEGDLQILYLALGDGSWRIRKEAKEILLALPRAGDLAGEIIELLHSEDNAGLRNTAVEILVSLGRQAVPPLLEEVSCNDQDVRKFVLDILGEIGDVAAVPAMIRALQDADENVKAAAAENLGKLGSPEAVPPLLAALEDTDLLFRFTVLESLGQIGVEVPLERLLLFKDDQLLRKPLYDCLGRIGGVEVLQTLIAGLSDAMRNVREAAAIATTRVARQHPVETAALLAGLADSPAADAIGGLLDSAGSEVRLSAVTLLGMVGDGRFAPRLLALLEDEGLREEAAAALIRLGRNAACTLTGLWPEADSRTRAYLSYIFGEAECEDSLSLLREGMNDPEPQLRMLAAQALGKLGKASAIPLLMRALGDEEEDVRETAMQSLGLLSSRFPQETLEILLPLLEARDSDQRMYAVTILARLDGPEAGRHLALALKDESPQVRRAAVRAFDCRTGDDQLPTLMLALTDEDTDVRRLATELMGASGDLQALAPLGLALQDEDMWVRATAVRSLGRLGTAGEEQIVAALSDSVGLVIIAALETIAEGDFARGPQHLIDALDHSDEEVVSAALNLLSAKGFRGWAQPVRLRLLNHSHWEVRSTFARVLAETTGIACRPWLEERLVLEGEDLVRQQIQDLLAGLPEELG